VAPEPVRRWVRQADIDDGIVAGQTSSEQSEQRHFTAGAPSREWVTEHSTPDVGQIEGVVTGLDR
jgi:hypothetical protein